MRGVARALSIHPAWGLVGRRAVPDLGPDRCLRRDHRLRVGPARPGPAGRPAPGAPHRRAGRLLIVAPLLMAEAFRLYPQWWVAVMLRVRMSRGSSARPVSTDCPSTPAGEVVARAMDADRYVRYADRWVDFVNGLVIVVVTAVAARSLLAGGVLLVVMVLRRWPRPAVARSRVAPRPRLRPARARFGRALVSALDSARTVKLAAATPDVQRPPAPRRRRPGAGRRARAPGAGGAGRRPHRAGAGRRRGGLGGSGGRRLGPGHRDPGGRRGERVRLVRPGRRRRDHRGAGHPGLAEGDLAAGRRGRSDGPAGRGRPGARIGAGAGPGHAGPAAAPGAARARRRARRRHHRRHRRGPAGRSR